MLPISKGILRLAIAIGLVGPFLLRDVSNSLEPYPAVLQPTGSGKIFTTDNILTFTETQLIAIQVDGSEHRVDTRAFVSRIPHRYWQPIADMNFGLGPAATQSVSLDAQEIAVAEVEESSLEERRAMLNWIHTRLAQQGLREIHRLSTRRIEVFYDKESGTEVGRKLTKQTDVDLN
ncbi:MAG: hypothetical protein WA783_16700 [Phormidesmis sp.]